MTDYNVKTYISDFIQKRISQMSDTYPSIQTHKPLSFLPPKSAKTGTEAGSSLPITRDRMRALPYHLLNASL